jgi:hypothetical protein
VDDSLLRGDECYQFRLGGSEIKEVVKLRFDGFLRVYGCEQLGLLMKDPFNPILREAIDME